MNYLLIINVLLPIFVGFMALWLRKREREIVKKEQHLTERSNRILMHAHERSNEAIDTAVKKATAILRDTKLSKTKVDQLLDEAAAEVAAEYKRDLHSTLEKIVSENRKELEAENKTAIKKLYDLENADELEFKKMMQDSSFNAKEYLRKKIDSEFAEAKKEVAAYKKAEMERFEARVQEYTDTLARELIGRSLSTAEHEDLIVAALDQAKKEGVFG